MIFKNIFGYSILKFNPENYYQVVQKLHDANLILTYTLHGYSEEFFVNKNFNDYLIYKNV